MCKNWKRATWLGIFLWVLVFVEISILIFLPWFKDNPLAVKIVHLPILAVFTIFLTCKYFKSVMPNAKEGFLLAIWMLVVANILDMIITVPLFVKSYSGFYGDIWLWLGFLVVIVFATFVGFKKGSCKLCKVKNVPRPMKAIAVPSAKLVRKKPAKKKVVKKKAVKKKVAKKKVAKKKVVKKKAAKKKPAKKAKRKTAKKKGKRK